MAEYILARQNDRSIPKEDKIFGISNRAKKMIAEKGADKVINATIGSLLDDDGKLIVLSSVDEVFRGLKPDEYADYAPICGIPAFREAVQKAAFGKFPAQKLYRCSSCSGRNRRFEKRHRQLFSAGRQSIDFGLALVAI